MEEKIIPQDKHEENIQFLNDVKHFYKLSMACKKCGIDRGNLYNLLNSRALTLKASDVDELVEFIKNDIKSTTDKYFDHS